MKLCWPCPQLPGSEKLECLDVAKFVQYLRNKKEITKKFHIYYIVAIYSVKGLQVLAVRL